VAGSAADAAASKRGNRSGPKSKSSKYIGVSQYRRTGRWEAHIWDSSGQPGIKGRQLHLGSFDDVIDAARAYDRAVLHFRGPSGNTNFSIEQYEHDPVLKALSGLTKEAFVLRLRNVAQTRRAKLQKAHGGSGGAPPGNARTAAAVAAARGMGSSATGSPAGSPKKNAGSPKKNAGSPKKKAAGKGQGLSVRAPVSPKKARKPTGKALSPGGSPSQKRKTPAKKKVEGSGSPRGGNSEGCSRDSPSATAALFPLSRAFHMGHAVNPGTGVLNPDIFGSLGHYPHNVAAHLGSTPQMVPAAHTLEAYGVQAGGYCNQIGGAAYPMAAPAHGGFESTATGGEYRDYATVGEGGSTLHSQLFPAEDGGPDRSDQTRGIAGSPSDSLNPSGLSLLSQLEGELTVALDKKLQEIQAAAAFADPDDIPTIPPLQVSPAQVLAPGKGEDWRECMMPSVAVPNWNGLDPVFTGMVVEGVGEVSAEFTRVAQPYQPQA